MQTQTKLQTQFMPLMTLVQAQLNQALSTQVPTSLPLRQQCVEVERLAHSYQLPVRYAFQMPVFSGHRLYQGQQYDWVFMNAQEHPLMRHRDKFPVPRRILTQLHEIAQIMDFDAIFVAEEVEKGAITPWKPLTVDQFTPPPSRYLVETADWLGRSSQSWWHLLASLTGIVALAPLALTVAVGLDPILFGVRTTTGNLGAGTPAAWFYLGHWAWNQE